MDLSKEEVIKVAKLSRIKLSGEEVDRFKQDLTGILNWIAILNEVNTDGVPQMFSSAHQKLPLREDVVTDGNIRDAILKNAPNSKYGCFTVPKVVEGN